MNMKKLMTFALDTGEVMLTSGAETYRVEDTINRILSHSDATDVQSFVTPTGLFASMDCPDGSHMSYIRRVSNREIHLERIEQTNHISRAFCTDVLTLDECCKQLLSINNQKGYPSWILMAGISLAAGLFAIVFGGTLMDGLVTTIAGIVLAGFQLLFKQEHLSQFFIDLIGAFLMSVTALSLIHIADIGDNQSIILVSGIMPLVPGVAITNAIRDTLHGHLVSGTARILDAFIVAASIATGVGLALSLFQQIMGGALL